MILQIPEDIEPKDTQTCALCRVKLPLAKATTGLHDASNRQRFACVSHFSEPELLIVGWADFIADERYKMTHQKRKAEAAGVENAWLDY
jgi:hypothetical protein